MYRLTQAKFLWLLLLFSREEPRLQQAPSPRGAQLTASAAALTNACPREAALLASQTSKSYFAHGVIAENLENQEGGRIRSPPGTAQLPVFPETARHSPNCRPFQFCHILYAQVVLCRKWHGNFWTPCPPLGSYLWDDLLVKLSATAPLQTSSPHTPSP